MEHTQEELQIVDIVAGTGKEVSKGDTIVMHYRGTLVDGREFDSSYGRGEPFSCPIGVGYVIAGWDIGIIGMKVGGKRKLVIPGHLGYGARGAGGIIGPNATLIFECELLDVR
jgi:FKBP-type peptidyl-prolyl cis-trans isomerase